MTTVRTQRDEATANAELTANAGGRLTFLDWTRGLAVVIMLQGHVFHSFNRTDLRDGGPFTLSQFWAASVRRFFWS